MNTSPHRFVTVDMRDLKVALVAQAKARRTSVSVVVREAVARGLAMPDSAAQVQQLEDDAEVPARDWVKLSIRFTCGEAVRIAAGAHAAGLSRGAYLAGLVDGVPVLLKGGRPEHIAALTVSCAELSTLSRNVHQLTALLSAGDVQRALVYRDLLDKLADYVGKHLRLAAQTLANLQPGRRLTSSGRAARTERRR